MLRCPQSSSVAVYGASLADPFAAGAFDADAFDADAFAAGAFATGWGLLGVERAAGVAELAARWAAAYFASRMARRLSILLIG